MILYHKDPYIETNIEYSESDEYLETMKFYIKDVELSKMSYIDSHDWMVFQYEIDHEVILTFEGLIRNFYFDDKLNLWILILTLYNTEYQNDYDYWVISHKRDTDIDNLLNC